MDGIWYLTIKLTLAILFLDKVFLWSKELHILKRVLSVENLNKKKEPDQLSLAILTSKWSNKYIKFMKTTLAGV